MKLKLKHQYTLLQSLYWISGSVLYGYAAVLLYHKGATPAQVGYASAAALFILIFAQQFVDKLLQHVESLTPKKMVILLMMIANIFYLLLGFLPVTGLTAIILFIIVHVSFTSSTPLVTSIGMEFINQGHDVNFSFSRGLGSFAYATSAFFMGQLVQKISPVILPYAFITSQVLVLVILYFLPELAPANNYHKKIKSAGLRQILKENRAILLFTIGFCLSQMANSLVQTYMVNVVYDVGGNNSTYGICCFLNAAVEFPAMILYGVLLHYFSSRALLKISSFFYIVKVGIIFFANSFPLVCLGYIMQALSFGGFNVIFIYLINSELKPQDRMKGQSIMGIVITGIGGGIGNLLGGFLQGHFGLTATLGAALIMTILGFVISMLVKKDK